MVERSKANSKEELKENTMNEEERNGILSQTPRTRTYHTGDVGSSLNSIGSERINRERSSFFKCDTILRVITRFAYGLLPCWPGSTTKCTALVSMFLVILQILAFVEYIYCVKNYWLKPGLHTPHIPIVTMVIELGLFASGIVSFILACRFFYAHGQLFQRSDCEIIPYVEFELEEQCSGPKPIDWFVGNVCFLVGFLDVAFIILVDMKYNSYFDFYGIHDFSLKISKLEKYIYYLYIAVFNWGLFCAVVSSCIFYILTRDIVRRVEATEIYIIEQANCFADAKKAHEDLLNYSEKLIQMIEKWFTAHNIFFFCITLCIVFKWFEFTSENSKFSKHHILWASEILASLLIAFKFCFPFLSASRATARFKKMYFNLNKKKLFDDVHEMARFLEYAERCNFGFVVFGVKITTNMAFITIVTTFAGIIKSLA